MSEWPKEVQSAINGLERLSLLAQLRDKVRDANGVSRRTCGGCYFHMKSRLCPREHNVNGWNRGPSINDSPCEKFTWDKIFWQIGVGKRQKADDFATKHGLPMPIWKLDAKPE